MKIVDIARDPFARQTLVRRVVSTAKACSWCGGSRLSGRLFKYGMQRDDNGRIAWHDGEFCSKPCHDNYHAY